MSALQFSPGNCACGCCRTIGFDSAARLGITGCCSPQNVIENLSLNVSRLTECRVVFAGNWRECGNAIRFSVSDWPTVRAYVQGGGRLWINAEHSGDYPQPRETSKCLQDMAALNNFLIAIGSSITYVGGDYAIFGLSVNGSFCAQMTPGSANIAQGLTNPLASNRFGEISFGTPVWTFVNTQDSGDRNNPPASRGGKQVVAGEKVGSGFVFVCGDGDVACSPDPFNPSYPFSGCQFFNRLFSYDDSQIL